MLAKSGIFKDRHTPFHVQLQVRETDGGGGGGSGYGGGSSGGAVLVVVVRVVVVSVVVKKDRHTQEWGRISVENSLLFGCLLMGLIRKLTKIRTRKTLIAQPRFPG